MFMAFHVIAAATAANSNDEEDPVAAVKGTKRSLKKKKRRNGGHQGNSTTFEEKKLPLCWLHIRFGDKAWCCEQPCECAMCMAISRKQGRRGAVAAECPGTINTATSDHLFFVYDL
jgi:hypothetical protein